jgi:hypothetical protein
MWQTSRPLPPFSIRASESRVGVLPIGLGFLRQFKQPTIFLKISCDGDYLLPVIVGDAAVEKLLDVPLQGHTEECPDQFQFVSAVVDKLGYEVNYPFPTHMLPLLPRIRTFIAGCHLVNKLYCIIDRLKW